VRDNQAVKKGDILISTQDELSERDYERLQAQIKEISAVLKANSDRTCKDCSKRMAKALEGALVVPDVPTLDETLAPVREMARQLLTAYGQYEQVDTLTAAARRQIALNSQKIAEVKRRRAEALLGQQMEQLTSEIVAARNQIAERKQALENTIDQTQTRVDVRLTALLSQLQIYRSQQNISAPIDGIVTRLTVSGPGQLIPAGTEILQLIPSASELIAELAVANKDISQIRVDMPVIVRLDALPERQYGTVNGVVQTVPVSIAPVADPSAPPTYTVTVKLDRQSITKNRVEYPFRIGMQLEGLVVTRHESMLMSGVRKLLSISDDIGG
jgi:multidrug resistance efflux pump